MSSQPRPELLGLAPELVQNVIKQVGDKGDLTNVRLSCKTLNKHATTELFKDVFVSPEHSHISSWNSISQHDVLRHVPRHAIIHTQPVIEDLGLDTFREREEIGEDFEEALAALSRFPNLDSVEIGFTPECVGADDHLDTELAESKTQREDMLKLIFQAIRDRAEDGKNRKIRKMTIINLQNYPLPNFSSSDLFRDVMSQLEELHISMTQEFNEHGPDHDYTKIELQTFPAYLCSDWLAPISTHLKALSVYHQTDNWGPFPGYFDPSGISFPKLETLALGYYTLAHDNDIDWILAIKSLRKLILQKCMIASWIKIDANNLATWKPRTRDWTKMPDQYGGSWCEGFVYDGKWSQNLDRIASDLPNLVDFRFDTISGWGDEATYGVEYRDRCGIRISPQRYVSFDNGILPTHWVEADDAGEIEGWIEELEDDLITNKHDDNFEADQKSLDALLEKLKSRKSMGQSGAT
ncbi:hypothetical protein DPSP01_009124 [Paraphaeosphaeria sporulosa]|uniref:F-box domain-containing protein n=1 Tax=Paraphaeosphaeria sporulosa TaxID=1460663 RepID=A0A177CKN3_9PLEO|nr:uncharacterized protein CC84DRAFT_1258488 [Paraphaeosphaeria sporulosa]OAG07357.1 hypothetical protein CC84DRAFT_1258488 [Paraphaeosphaeria sporulosa]